MVVERYGFRETGDIPQTDEMKKPAAGGLSVLRVFGPRRPNGNIARVSSATPFWVAVRGTSRCALFIASDLSGFVFSSPLTDPAAVVASFPHRGARAFLKVCKGSPVALKRPTGCGP